MVFGAPELLRRFREGDEEALKEVYGQCVEFVTRTAGAVLRACAAGTSRGPDELAGELSDVVQEVFVKAFAPEARRRFDASRPYKPYLAQIARNAAVDHWRQMRRYVPSDLEQLIEQLSLDVEAASADVGWADADTVAVVERYLASLDPESRRVHDALYVRGLSQRETAVTLGLGRQVVRTTEANLRRGLRRELSRAARPMPMPLRSVATKQSG